MGRCWRAVLIGQVISAIVIAGVAPTLHAHEADAHHSETLVHRHAHIHTGLHHPEAGSDSSMSTPERSDDDADAIWMPTQSVERTQISGAFAVGVAAESFSFPTTPKRLALTGPRDDSLPHGPPAGTSRLRAPPTPAI